MKADFFDHAGFIIKLKSTLAIVGIRLNRFEYKEMYVVHMYTVRDERVEVHFS